jgi:hypothetical protein
LDRSIGQAHSFFFVLTLKFRVPSFELSLT